ncbi:MAG: hypothetical protein U0031_16605 [Thermomicrobiales bacterium]
MDGQRFDAVTRSLASLESRRSIVRRLILAAGALFAAALPVRARAGFNCTYIGCGCATGTLHPCNDPLVCCASSPGTPGGAGVCSNASDCDAACAGSGGYCSDSCNWGDNCPECCSGWCGNTGRCA